MVNGIEAPTDAATLQAAGGGGTQEALPTEGAPIEGLITATQIEERLSAAPDEAKALLADHLTPEFASLQGMIYGEEAGQYFAQFADPSIVLVPLDRQAVEQELQGLSQQGAPTAAPQAPAQAATPVAAPPAAPQAAPTSGPSGGLLAT